MTPVLLINEEKIRELKIRIAQDASMRHLYEKLRIHVDDILENRTPPAYYESENESDGWQRTVGNAMPGIAMCWLLSGERRYLEGAELWANRSCSYPQWGRGHHRNVTLIAAHQLIGLSLLADWCGDALSAAARTDIENTLLIRGRDMYRAATGQTSIFWEKQWIQNHMWICTASLLTAGLYLLERSPECGEWIARAEYNIRKSLSILGDDGADPEGFLYWEYGTQYLFEALQLLQERCGVDLYETSPWLRHTAEYALYTLLPPGVCTKERNVAPFGDCDENCFGTYGAVGPSHHLRYLAAHYQDGYAQYAADFWEKSSFLFPETLWLNLIWRDGSVGSRSPEMLPRMRCFADQGLVSWRSDWNSAEASALYFRCAPYMGRKIRQLNQSDPYEDWGGGHAHPDVGHLSVFAGGQ